MHDDHYVQYENISTKGSKKYTNKVPTIIVAKVYLGFFFQHTFFAAINYYKDIFIESYIGLSVM